APDAQEALGLDLWKWRAETQPASYDDIPRVERPVGFTPDWSQAAIGRRRATLAELEKRWRALPARTDVPAEIGRRLPGSTLARVRWELDVTASWRRDPSFYLDQALCDAIGILLVPQPFDTRRSQDLVHRLEAVPGLLDQARANLDQMRGPFVRV